MNKIKKVSEITVDDVADYIRLDDVTSDERDTLETLLHVSKEYVKSYTGITDLDNHSDFIIVILILCQDMYDNRIMYVNKDLLNKTVDTILNMHRENLL